MIYICDRLISHIDLTWDRKRGRALYVSNDAKNQQISYRHVKYTRDLRTLQKTKLGFESPRRCLRQVPHATTKMLTIMPFDYTVY